MTAITTYEICIDTARTGLYAADIDDVTLLVASANFSHGMGAAYDEVSPPAFGAFELINHDGRFDVEAVSATYYQKLLRGTLVRVRATSSGTTTQLYEGRIKQIMPTLGEGRAKRVTVITECPMNALLAAEYSPALQENVTADVAITPIFDDAIITYPYAGSFWLMDIDGHAELDATAYLYDHDVIDFDTGATVFDFVGDNLGGEAGLAAQSFIRDYVAAELGGRFFFDARSGQFKFHNRNRDLLNTTVSASFARLDAESVDYIYGDDVFNKVTIHYRPRDVGAAASVLWSQSNLPMSMGPTSTRQLTARYRDATQQSARVGGKDFIEPQSGVDYIVNLADDGSSVDVTYSLTVSVVFGASSADITLVNPRGQTVYFTTLQLRGTPLTIFDQQYVTAINGVSVGMNGLIEDSRQISALSDAELAQNYATLLVDRFGTPAARVDRLRFDVNDNATHADKALFRSIGDRLRLTDDVDKDYILVGEEHAIMGAGSVDIPATHIVTWVLKPFDDHYSYWLLETAGYSELDSTTRLAL